ncbi:MAG: hypothetical protein ACTSWN_00420 [Promethearchaeota archaeon]
MVTISTNIIRIGMRFMNKYSSWPVLKVVVGPRGSKILIRAEIKTQST